MQREDNQELYEQNDFNDFKMPYKIYGKQDLANMKAKYSRLNNYSQGTNVRFNNNGQT